MAYTVVRFRSGIERILITPSRAELVRAWADAVEGRSGDRVAVLSLLRVPISDRPEQRERVDLTAIESLRECDYEDG